MADSTRQGSEAAPRRALIATVAAIVPGAGHAVLALPALAAALFGASVLCGAAVVWHLGWGLSLFESPLGAFLFGVVLRGLAILIGFSVVDAHLRSVQPAGDPGEVLANRQRLAVLFNLLIPGTGYAVARAWLRAATGVALLALVLFFARAGTQRYLDLIYLVLQLIMGFAVLRHVQLERDRLAQQDAKLQQPLKVPAAQIVVLVVLVALIGAIGYVTEQALPQGNIYGLEQKDIKHAPSREGLRFTVDRIGLSIVAVGDGWTVGDRPRYLFVAEHGDEATLMVGVQAIPPFMRQTRFVRRLRQSFAAQGLVHQKTTDLRLNGVPAVQMRFTGDFGERHIDHWAVAVPRKGFTYVMMFYCTRSSCGDLAPLLEKSRDSFTLK